jgi:Type IV secretion system pilin
VRRIASGLAAAGLNAAQVNDLSTVISNLTAWIIGILAVVATLFLTIGGVRYLVAGGDPSEVERAKSALKNAAIGYALALLAPVLLDVLRGILGVA